MTEVDDKQSDPHRQDLNDDDPDKGRKGTYPKSVFFIICTEFCERFSYYGMRTILFIYLSKILLYSEADTKSIYHGFTMACYFMPLLGAIIADSYLGKYKTIFYISIIYAIGNGVLSAGAFDLGPYMQRLLSITGLALIALGTGGIKPCVAAFGGDQFVKGQEIWLEQFFSFFYMCINAGSTLSTAITPLLRATPCNGQDSCFPLAFGVPAILMVVSVVIFVSGRPYYRLNPPGENVIVKLGGCISRAIVNNVRGKNGNKAHWLDHADDKYDQKFIEDVKAVCRVMLIFIPVPIFWALFDQQGSTWTSQATQMRWSVLGVPLLPEQMQLLNPLLILILAPLFSYIIYPVFQKIGLLTKPLQKMVVGGLLASASFFVCMLLQVAVEQQDANAMTLINSVPCSLEMSYVINDQKETGILAARDSLRIARPWPEEINFKPQCPEVKEFKYSPPNSYRAALEKIISKAPERAIVTEIPTLGKGNYADVKVFILDKNLSLELTDHLNKSYDVVSAESEQLIFMRAEVPAVAGHSYTLSADGVKCPTVGLEVGYGYTFIIDEDNTCSFNVTRVSPNLSLSWQAPQYILITAGEVMFSVTGLEFSYSQAPKSMKSVLQAGWLLTVAVGNLFVVIVAKVGLQKQSTEFMVFGFAMLGDMIFFAVLAFFYRPVKQSDTSEDHNEMPTEKTPLRGSLKGWRSSKW
ncbi:solute carrier family 15 member 2 [Galendromus occidentalis]|uniref:Oligopeptide transporter 1 n=1 Tax=Galendromus occidentalis TaxID=34638 RepID=A0AAJ6QPP1_9ACAR|nr:solute carrier family 15 member 2 [Galendromus occidentalis]